jgi:flagellar biosynthetic protein FliP
MFFCAWAGAQNLPLVTSTTSKVGTVYAVPVQTLLALTALSFLPAALMLMTSFIRILIVFSMLRQALGLQSMPPNMVLVGLSLFLTLFIMSPVLTEVYQNALVPYLQQGLNFDKALAAAEQPLRGFMVRQTREDDIALFMEMAQKGEVAGSEAVAFTTLVPAFITSELKSAFTIGFLIYIPFVVIDLIVASVLMSMGMMMLSPMMISMPFKLMLFVLIDGWSLIMGSLAASFVTS